MLNMIEKLLFLLGSFKYEKNPEYWNSSHDYYIYWKMIKSLKKRWNDKTKLPMDLTF
jgi:hypothetical protein